MTDVVMYVTMLGALKGGSAHEHRAYLKAWREALRCEALGRDTRTADKCACSMRSNKETRTQKIYKAPSDDALTRVARTTGQRGSRA